MSDKTEHTVYEIARARVTQRDSKTPCGANEKYLKSAKPQLIVRAERTSVTREGLEHHVTVVEKDLGWDEILDEGYSDIGPLGPVYWRIVKRGDEHLYLSTFLATRDHILRIWGPGALANCDPITGTAPARVEGVLSRP
jgi:hypothetical protein